MHNCTKQELGVESDQQSRAKFLPIRKENRELVNFHSKKFKCVDEEDLYMYGDYNSDKASLFNIQLVKCKNETRSDCKSEHQIM